MVKVKALSILALLLLSVFANIGFADLSDDWDVAVYDVELNGRDYNGYLKQVDFEDEIELSFTLMSYRDIENCKAMAVLATEYDQDKAMDSSSMFDLKADREKEMTLSLDLPESVDAGEYVLNLIIFGDESGNVIYTEQFDIAVESDAKHNIKIKDVIVTPEVVKAGRQIKVKAKMENLGNDDEDDVKITASIPELQISESDYISELEQGETKYSEPLYLITEKCTEAGTYDLVVKVTYSSGKESTETKIPVEIASSEACIADTESVADIKVKIDKASSTMEDGSAEFSIALSNSGESELVSLEADSDALEFEFSPKSDFLLNNDEMKQVTMTVTAKSGAASGEHSFVLSVKTADGEIAKQTLTVDVESNSFVNALEIGLVIVVILLAILGLIIGFNKMKEDDDEADEELTSQTYY